jgi:hypothetical protein
MSRYLILYVGPPRPADASHAGWPEWFAALGDRLVDRGAPLTFEASLGAAVDDDVHARGYSVILADDADHARTLLRDHPYLAAGPEGGTIELFALPPD